MKYQELKEQLIAIAEQYEDITYRIGFRFDEREYEVGQQLDFNSRSNFGRDDEREFPAYGTDEYYEMDELDGVCAYMMDLGMFSTDQLEEEIDTIFGCAADREIDTNFAGHIYVLTSERNSDDFCEDDYEILLPEPTVVAKLI